MPYKELLKEIIEKSKLTYKEISKKCSMLGKPVDPSYISKIVNGKVPPPSNEISRVLAEVCGTNKNILVLENILDNAPDELTSFIKNIYFAINSDSFLYRLEQALLKQESYDFNEEANNFINELNYKPLSSFILENNSEKIFNKALAIAKYNAEYFNGLNLDNLAEEVNKNPSDSIYDIIKRTKGKSILDCLPSVNDDSMAPTFPNGTKFYIVDDNYSEGDIVVYIERTTNETFIRKFNKKDDLMIFSPINANYSPNIYNKDEATILGKASIAIIEL